MGEWTFDCRWRIELAQQICKKIDGFEGVKSIAVVGSVARGYADEYSDLELAIFWETRPDEAARKRIVSELNADYFYPNSYEANEDNVIFKGFRIDLWHLTTQDEEAAIAKAMQEHDTDLRVSNAIDTVRSCVPLYGEKILLAWKDKVKEYPAQAAVTCIEECLRRIDCTQVDLYIRRRNVTLLHETIAQLQKELFLILLALNGQYFPTFKWMYRSLERMSVKPENIEERFRAMFSAKPEQAFAQIKAVIRETLALVHAAYPQVDTQSALGRLESARVPHTQPVRI